jgi:hypothetical protein
MLCSSLPGLTRPDPAIHQLDDRFHETDQVSFAGLGYKMLQFRVSHMIRILEALV